MKLYYVPGACSLAPHIVALEAGLTVELDQVNLADRTTASGEAFAVVNPKGYVPALRLESGDVLTEASAIVQYLAEKAPQAGLAPAPGTPERYKLLEWLGFISTEIHKGFGPLWNKANPEAVRQAAIDKLQQRFEYLDKHLAGRSYLLGEAFSIADAYAFTVINWTNFHGLDISRHRNLGAFLARVAARPKVQEALKAEGLLKQAA